MLLKAEFEAQMSYLEPSIEAMLTAGEGDSDDDSDDDSGDDNDDEKGDDNGDDSKRYHGKLVMLMMVTVLSEGVSLACYLAPRVPA